METPDQEKLLFSSKDFFNHLIHCIEQAKSTIDIETYIFVQDPKGVLILNHLRKASKRGVKIRLLIDGVGSSDWTLNTIKTWEDKNFRIRIFNPLFWQKREFDIKPLKWLIALHKANRRNHRKTCLFDESSALIGSFNICEHSSHPWRDSAVYLSNIDITELKNAFQEAWGNTEKGLRKFFALTPIESSIQKKSPVFLLNNSFNKRKKLFNELIYRIFQANEIIWITNAYFIPDHYLLKALKFATWRDVDVRIILSKDSDLFFMKWASSVFYENLANLGVKIYQYQESILHAKTLIIDQWAIVGSRNLNHRSLIHDLEVDVKLQTAEGLLSLKNQFDIDISKSEIYNTSKKSPLKTLKHTLGRLFLLLKHWL